MERAIILTSRDRMVRIPIWDRLQSRRPPFRVILACSNSNANCKIAWGENWPRREFSNNLGVYAARLGGRNSRRRSSGRPGGTPMGHPHMSDDFEDHCWKDIVTPDILDIYSHYRRKTFVGPAPALLAIDLYELVYRGGAK